MAAFWLCDLGRQGSIGPLKRRVRSQDADRKARYTPTTRGKGFALLQERRPGRQVEDDMSIVAWIGKVNMQAAVPQLA